MKNPINDADREKLIENGMNPDQDHPPVVMIDMQKNNFHATYLLSEMDPEEPRIAFGLADLHMQCPELGSVDLEEIFDAADKYQIEVKISKMDRIYPMSVFAQAAREAGEITVDDADLSQAKYNMDLKTIRVNSPSITEKPAVSRPPCRRFNR